MPENGRVAGLDQRGNLRPGWARELGNAGIYDYGTGSFFRWAFDDEVPMMWPNSITVFHRMRRDGMVKASERAIAFPLRRTEFYVRPNGASDEVVEHVANDLGLAIEGADEPPALPRRHGRFTWQRHLADALPYLWFGHMPFEQIYQLDDGGGIHLRKLAPRMPETIAAIHVEKDGGLRGIEQYDVEGKSPIFIPVDRLVWYAHDKEGANWWGMSVLRSAYMNWMLKHRTYKARGIFLERANGFGSFTGAEGAGEKEIADGLTYATQLHSGEFAGYSGPFGSNLEYKGFSGSVPDHFTDIDHHDISISRSMLQQFLNLGSTETGARALGETFTGFAMYAYQTILEEVTDVATAHIVEDLVDLNWGPDETAPQIIAGDVGGSLDLMVDAIANLINVGAITVDENIENQVRKALRLPPRDEDTPPIQSLPEVPEEDEGAPLSEGPSSRAELHSGGTDSVGGHYKAGGYHHHGTSGEEIYGKKPEGSGRALIPGMIKELQQYQKGLISKDEAREKAKKLEQEIAKRQNDGRLPPYTPGSPPKSTTLDDLIDEAVSATIDKDFSELRRVLTYIVWPPEDDKKAEDEPPDVPFRLQQMRTDLGAGNEDKLREGARQLYRDIHDRQKSGKLPPHTPVKVKGSDPKEWLDEASTASEQRDWSQLKAQLGKLDTALRPAGKAGTKPSLPKVESAVVGPDPFKAEKQPLKPAATGVKTSTKHLARDLETVYREHLDATNPYGSQGIHHKMSTDSLLSAARAAVKRDINTKIRDRIMQRLDRDPELRKWINKQPADKNPTGGKSQPYNKLDDNELGVDSGIEDETALRRHRIFARHIRATIDTWAASAGDSQPRSIAVQHVAADVFEVDDSHLESLRKYGSSQAQYAHEQGLPTGLDWARDILKDEYPFLKAFLEEMYLETQERFKAEETKTVGLYRGFYPGAAGGPIPEGETDLNMNPLSSWASRKSVAKHFGSTIFTASVPVENVLCSSRTGFGCLNETEFILIQPKKGKGRVKVEKKGGYYD
jgi:hypothetical protein